VKTKVPVKAPKEPSKSEEDKEAKVIYEEKLVDTPISIKNLYNLGNVQFAPIEKKQYSSNPKGNIRAIYISLHGMYHLDDYIELSKKTEINTFVLDIKDDHGRTLFESETAKNNLGDFYIRPRSKDIHKLMKKLKDNNIYVIGRISTFKDEAYSNANPNNIILDKRYNRAYMSRDKISWLDPYNRDVWYYNIQLGKEAAKFGFNEVLFDYVRFPDRVHKLERDNKLRYNNVYSETKPEVIQRFLKYAHDELSKEEVYISASVFGQIGISKDDENLGQHWESISNVVDFINPMAYPSHYAYNTYNIKNPDNEPFKLLNKYTKDVLKRNSNLKNPATIETWIQGFSASWVPGFRKYGALELKEQIRALKEEGLYSYLVWNPSSKYYWDGFKGNYAEEDKN
jgi:hypothetical protein